MLQGRTLAKTDPKTGKGSPVLARKEKAARVNAKALARLSVTKAPQKR